VEALARAEAPYLLPIYGELFSVTFDRYRAAGVDHPALAA